MAQQHTNKFKIDVDGAPLADGADQSLVSAYVDDNTNLPDLFQLVFRDPARAVLQEANIKIGSKIKIAVVSDEHPGGEPILVGEVTAVEAEFDPGGMMTVVRGLDPSHRLFRGRVTETYRDATYSDIATKVAKRVGLELGRIESSPTVHPHISQANLTDWQFLKGLANEIGFEIGCFDGKFEFRKPRQSSDAPGSGDLQSDQPLQLILGSNLLRFRSIVTSAEQVKEVKVRGWDVRQKRELVGTAPARTTSATIGVRPPELAETFKSPDYVGVDTPYGTQAEVDAAAKALAEQIAGAFAEFEGVARGNPRLRAGSAVSLGLAKEPFDGKYILTTTRHVYDPKDGYTTWFTVSGRQERSLFGLTSGTGSTNGATMGPPIYGVVPAIVTDTRDPDQLCRVKLKFPWLSDTYTSDWARTVQSSAGEKRGGLFMSEVNDEVLVAFEQGDVRRPYVIGGLYNGKDKPELGRGIIDSTSGAVNKRAFVSKNGHKLAFFDSAAQSGILLISGDKNLEMSLNEGQTKIKINSTGDITITGGKVTIESSSTMDLKASAGITIDGGPQVEVKGGIIRLN